MAPHKKSILNFLIPSNTDFSFFERSVEILVVDDEPTILELYSEYLSHYKLYNVCKASCAKEAEVILLSNKRIHVCIMDLGLTDLNNDEYYLVKEFSPKTSFIVATGRDSLEAGFKAHCLGVCAAIKKPLDFENLSVLNEINSAFLQSIFKKGTKDTYKPVIVDAIEVLISNKPTEMKFWLEMLNVNERYLRRVWVECFGYQPRYLIILYNMFLTAFEYYSGVYSKKLRLKNHSPGIMPHDFDYVNQRFKAMYQKHQKEIDRILRN